MLEMKESSIMESIISKAMEALRARLRGAMVGF